jgi:hypothetical protein
MIALTVNLDGDGALKGIGHLEEADAIEVLVLDHGMASGKPSVTLHITFQNAIGDRHVVAQTSARLFCTAAKMIEAKYPDLFAE